MGCPETGVTAPNGSAGLDLTTNKAGSALAPQSILCQLSVVVVVRFALMSGVRVIMGSVIPRVIVGMC